MRHLRLTLFGPDGTTPLMGGAEGTFGTDPTHPRPYLGEILALRKTEIDFAKGGSVVGALTIPVIDKATDGNQDHGVVTSIVASLPGARALLERLEESEWRPIFEGACSGYRLGGSPAGLVTYELSLADPRWREGQAMLFERNETFVVFGANGATGPRENYGELPSGEYLLPAVAPFLSFEGALHEHFQRNAPAGGIFSGLLEIRNSAVDAATWGAPEEVIGGGAYQYREASVRWRAAGSEDEWTVLRNMPTADFRNMVRIPSDGHFSEGGSARRMVLYLASYDTEEIPANGEAIEFQILATRTTEATPLLWDEGTAGELLRAIYDGGFTEEAPGIRYSEGGMALFEAESPRVRFIVTAPVENMARWVEENIYRRTAYAPGFDAEGRIYPKPWRRPPVDPEALPAVTVDEIIPIGDAEATDEHVVNVLEIVGTVEGIESQETTTRKTGSREYLIAGPRERETVTTNYSRWERFFVEERKDVVVLDAASVLRFGTKPLKIEATTLRSIGEVEGKPAGGDLQDDPVSALRELLAGELAFRYTLPPQRFQVRVRATSEMLDLAAGDFFRLYGTFEPDHARGVRTFAGVVQILGLSDAEPHIREMDVEACGVSVPSLAEFANQEDCLTGGSLEFLSDGDAVRVFLEDGTLTNVCDHPVTVRLLGQAGGGGGGNGVAGGGGGAGGCREFTNVTINAGQAIPVTVGAGGAVQTNGGDTILWVDSSGNALDPNTANPNDAKRLVGGGRGGSTGLADNGAGGGSGGGGRGAFQSGFASAGGAGTSGQGNAGGAGVGGDTLDVARAGGGGGGGPAGAGGSGAVTAASLTTSATGGTGGGGLNFDDWDDWQSGAGGGGGADATHDDPPVTPPLFAPTVTPGTRGSPHSERWGNGGNGASGPKLVLGVEEEPARVAEAGHPGVLFVRYTGPLPGLTIPVITSVSIEADGRAKVTIDADDWPTFTPEGYRVAIEYAVGDPEPAANSGRWRHAGYLTEPGDVYTPQLPTGATIHVRARAAEASNYLPTAPGTTTTDATPDTPGLLDLALDLDEGLTWTPNQFTAAVRLTYEVTTEPGDEPADPMADLAHVEASVGFYDTTSIVVPPDGVLHVDVEAYPNWSEPEGEIVAFDDFARADSSDLGAGWVEHDTGFEIASNRLRCSSATNNRQASKVGISRGEMFAQAIVRVDSFTNGAANLLARFERPGAASTASGYGLRVLGSSSPRLVRMDGATATAIASGAGTDVQDTDTPVQLYVADDLQQGWTPNGTVSGTDNALNGENDRTVGFRHERFAGTPVSQYDSLLVFESKYIVVTGLPSGWKAKVLNSGESIVATATESSGTASVDCSRFGSATEVVPGATGWPHLIVTNGADVEQARWSGAVIPGLVAAFDEDSLSFQFASGTPGRTYRVQALRFPDTSFAGLLEEPGDLLFLNDALQPDRLPAGSDGMVLTLSGGLPEWSSQIGPIGIGTPYVNIGGNPPTGIAKIYGDNVTVLDLLLTGAGGALITGSRWGASAAVNLRRANGAPGSDSAVLSTQTVAVVAAFGYDGANASNAVGSMVFRATENFTTGARGTRFEAWTVTTGTTTLVERFRAENATFSILSATATLSFSSATGPHTISTGGTTDLVLSPGSGTVLLTGARIAVNHTVNSQFRRDTVSVEANAIEVQNRDATAATLHESGVTFGFADTSANALNAGSIYVKKEQEWTTTGGTRDSLMAFRVALNGARVNRLALFSTGGIVFGGSTLPTDPGAGVIETIGAYTLRTSTGILTLATAAGDGDVLISPHGTGRLRFGTVVADPTATIAGTVEFKDAAGATHHLLTGTPTP